MKTDRYTPTYTGVFDQLTTVQHFRIRYTCDDLEHTVRWLNERNANYPVPEKLKPLSNGRLLG